MRKVVVRRAVEDSGQQIENMVFKHPIKDLNLPPAMEEEVRELIIFKWNPDIDCAVLMAAPFRGSSIASNSLGQIGAWLIRLPFDIVESIVSEVTLHDAVRDEIRPTLITPSNSVNSLRPDNPFLEAYLKLPLRKGVSIHTIIAQTDKDAAKLEGSDGVVSYSSAHLDGVTSEKIILGAGHSSVLKRDECLQEIWRILDLHETARSRSR